MKKVIWIALILLANAIIVISQSSADGVKRRQWWRSKVDTADRLPLWRTFVEPSNQTPPLWIVRQHFNEIIVSTDEEMTLVISVKCPYPYILTEVHTALTESKWKTDASGDWVSTFWLTVDNRRDPEDETQATCALSILPMGQMIFVPSPENVWRVEGQCLAVCEAAQ